MTGTRVHFMGAAGVQNTACNRYVALAGSPVRWTPDEAKVTCLKCQAALHR